MCVCVLHIDSLGQVYLQEVEQRFSPWVWSEWSNSEEYRSAPWTLNGSLGGPYDSTEQNLELWRSIKQTVQREQVRPLARVCSYEAETSAWRQGSMLPYRRRQFEATAMMNEMLQRCHIIEDLSEPHPTTAAQCHIQRSLSMPEGDEQHMVIVPTPLNTSLHLAAHLAVIQQRDFFVGAGIWNSRWRCRKSAIFCAGRPWLHCASLRSSQHRCCNHHRGDRSRRSCDSDSDQRSLPSPLPPPPAHPLSLSFSTCVQVFLLSLDQSREFSGHFPRAPESYSSKTRSLRPM